MSTRIVGGTAGGRRLVIPSSGTRPTAERAREAMFNSLGDLVGLRVLDLFAGSGAVGLEALSRGAAEAVLVDSARSAWQAIEANIAALGLAGARLERCSARSFLAVRDRSAFDRSGFDDSGFDDSQFDIVFADPPYVVGDGEIDQLLSELTGWLAPGADLVIERSARSRQPHWPDVIEATKSRRYGDSVLWYGRLR